VGMSSNARAVVVADNEDRVAVVADTKFEVGAVSGLSSAASFDAVYRHEYESLVRLAFVLTGRRDIAEELVQDSFEAAHRRWDRVSRYDKPGAWVRRVVLQRCIGRHRRLGVETKALLRLTARPPEFAELTVPDETLLRAIRRLPPRQAQVIVLICIEDRSADEVSELMECGSTTVRTHLRRGRLALAAALNLTDEVAKANTASNTTTTEGGSR
jgi:RNA polymerase sigma-70 factor, ECF subfamily